ncbi:MAG: hypothetical protein SFZ24_01815 [Planctomycetota bacterium]|nr:hypothetical protein [Planctomycetota bacterium]
MGARAALLAGLVCLLTACSSSTGPGGLGNDEDGPPAPSAARAAPANAAGPGDRTIDVTPGDPWLIPLAAGSGATPPLPLPAFPPLRSAAGQRIDAQPVYIAAEVDPALPPGWLGPELLWSARTPQEVEAEASGPGRDQSGFWALLARPEPRLPPSSVRLGSETIDVRTLRARAAFPAVRAPLPQAPTSAWRGLGDRLASLRASPAHAWRIELLAERVGPARLWSTTRRPPLADPALETMRTRNIAAWRTALQALADSDAELARQVIARLSCVMLLPSGTLLPAWASEAEAAALLLELLDHRRSAGERAEVARQWLLLQPEAAAWIIDDAPPVDAPGARRRVRTMLANLTTELRRGAIIAPGGGGAEAALAPGTCAVLECEVAPLGGSARLNAVLGSWSAPLDLLPAPVPAAPPGVAMGPLVPEWTMNALTRGATGFYEPAWSGSALLEQGETGRWRVYVELRGGDADSDDDATGPDDASADAPRAAKDRLLVHVRGAQGAERTLTLERPRSEPRWSGSIELPDALTRGGMLRIGLERIDQRGVRTTWPRPAMPGTAYEARAVVDLRAWRGLDPLPEESGADDTADSESGAGAGSSGSGPAGGAQRPGGE